MCRLQERRSIFPVAVTVTGNGPGDAVSQTWQITVADRVGNRAPTILSAPTLGTVVGQLYGYNLAATDPDHDVIRWNLDQGPAGMSLDPGRGTLRWVPQPEQAGIQHIFVRAIDTYGASVTQSFDITVYPANVAPTIVSVAPTTAAVGTLYFYAVKATDADSDSLGFSITGPNGMAIDASTGVIKWTPTAGGTAEVTVHVADGHGNSADQEYVIVVSSTAPDQPPVIGSQPPLVATVGHLYQYQVVACDPDDATLIYSLTQAPAGMSIDATTGLVTWTPTVDQIPRQTVTVKVSDPAGNAARQTFTITVQDNHPPQITSLPVTSVTAGLLYRYDVRAIDIDGDPLHYSLLAGPSGMTVDDNGRIVWQVPPVPHTDPPTTYTVTVQAADPFGGTDAQTYTLTVNPDTTIPTIKLTIVTNPIDMGKTEEFLVFASDNVGVADLALTVGGVNVPLDRNGGVASQERVARPESWMRRPWRVTHGLPLSR